MKRFGRFTIELEVQNLFEATDLSTAMETVIGICYQAAFAGGKKGKDILLDAIGNNTEFKKASSVWDKGNEKDNLKGLLIFGNKIVDAVGGDGTYQIQTKGQMTDDWMTWAKKKGADTSKTDIVIGGYKYSVKNADGAQLMSGKKGESIATANAAAKTAKIDTVASLISSMNKLEEATTEGYYASVKVMKKFRDSNPRATDKMQTWAEKEVKKWETLKDKLAKEKDKKKAAELKKQIKAANPSKEMKTMATPKGKANSKLAPTYISKENKKLLKNMDTIFKKNQEEVKKNLEILFKKNNDFKLGFVFEAASGKQKFGKKAIQTAEYMFVWKPVGAIETFKVKEHKIDTPSSKTIKEYAKQIDLQVNWKGSSKSNHLGYNVYQNVRLGVKEVQFESTQLFENYNRQYDTYENYLSEDAISEGAFFDRITSLATQLMSGIKKIWSKFVGMIKEAVSKIKEFSEDGISALGNMFGFEMDVTNSLLNNGNLKLKI
jgi:hypothetical protein